MYKNREYSMSILNPHQNVRKPSLNCTLEREREEAN
jgi:hypothetical protein